MRLKTAGGNKTVRSEHVTGYIRNCFVMPADFVFPLPPRGEKSLEICGVCLYTRQLFKFIGE